MVQGPGNTSDSSEPVATFDSVTELGARTNTDTDNFLAERGPGKLTKSVKIIWQHSRALEKSSSLFNI